MHSKAACAWGIEDHSRRRVHALVTNVQAACTFDNSCLLHSPGDSRHRLSGKPKTCSQAPQFRDLCGAKVDWGEYLHRHGN
mmetsp:Transcript_111223/g.287535  ORF Transcript_111223/g.287535 Transcript_111223/m.287535 type:complete len:81 (-) Transcript_111223:10-252(-)